jgi:hypothetical protein
MDVVAARVNSFQLFGATLGASTGRKEKGYDKDEGRNRASPHTAFHNSSLFPFALLVPGFLSFSMAETDLMAPSI